MTAVDGVLEFKEDGEAVFHLGNNIHGKGKAYYVSIRVPVQFTVKRNDDGTVLITKKDADGEWVVNLYFATGYYNGVPFPNANFISLDGNPYDSKFGRATPFPWRVRNPLGEGYLDGRVNRRYRGRRKRFRDLHTEK